MNKNLTKEFQDFINSFQKANRKGVMTVGRIKLFNDQFDTNFQIYNPKDSHFHPRYVSEELDWVLYLHNSHFCLIRRNNKALGIKEIEENYEQVWKTCRDDNTITQVSPLKLNVFPTIHDDCLFAWDCETYCEEGVNKAIPYCSTLVNLEKLRKTLDDYNNYLNDFYDFNETLDFKPPDPIPEEFYNRLMNIVKMFVGTDCIDQKLKHLGQYDRKRLTLISHNGSGFDNWIILKNHEKSSLAAWRNSSNLPMNLRKITDIDITKYTEDNWEPLRHE
ncbi:hypothetical protein LOTGIDRAFT_170922 [Lottia gigantea]|uniref:DNA-directed DNA polymerase n=1 Tax=Lottia gigantea TaxID=225164 RepID=V4CP77_LOTGI|nr:hypothetical protein LOTGIDRAFT_170922 [Lottia gigantea]ESP04225.1 hypothetical protein LOTGIDRAFT_170922 [Lottia gigantea]